MTQDAYEKNTTAGWPFELYRFARGADVWLFTSGDLPVVFNLESYTPVYLTRSSIAQTKEDAAGNVTVTVARDNAIAAMFIEYMPQSSLSLVIYRGHYYPHPSTGAPIFSEYLVASIFTGQIVGVEFSGAEASLTCMPATEGLRKRIPVTQYQAQCNNDLYGTKCGVTAAAWQLSGVLTAASGMSLTSSTFGTVADGWLNNGYIETSDGTRRWILDHAGSTITVNAPASELAVGASFSAFAGCDRTMVACKTKFNNFPKFYGFPHIPNKNIFESGM